MGYLQSVASCPSLNYTRYGACLVLRHAIRKRKAWEHVEQEQHALAEGVFL